MVVSPAGRISKLRGDGRLPAGHEARQRHPARIEFVAQPQHGERHTHQYQVGTGKHAKRQAVCLPARVADAQRARD